MEQQNIFMLRGLGLLGLMGLGVHMLNPKKKMDKNMETIRTNAAYGETWIPKTLREPTDEDMPRIKLLMCQGLDLLQIAQVMNLSQPKLSMFLDSKGMTYYRTKQARHELVKNLASQGLSVHKISKRLGIHRPVVLETMKELGIKPNN